MFKSLLFVFLLYSSSCFSQELEINNLILKGDYNSAIQKTNALILEQPQNLNLKFQYANLLALTQQSDLAITEYLNIIKSDPSFVEAYNNIGVLYSNKDLLNLAETYFKSAIDINPKYNVSIENLGDLYLKLSIQSYKKILVNDINNENALSKFIKTKSLLIDLKINSSVQKVKS